MTILLVDDSQNMRGIQKKLLAVNPGAEFIEAADGYEALAAFAESRPIDFAIIDWNIPNMDGTTLVKKIREIDRKTPIIMCTSEAERPRVVEALKAGVNNYVVKPFTGEVLLQKIQATLTRAKLVA